MGMYLKSLSTLPFRSLPSSERQARLTQQKAGHLPVGTAAGGSEGKQRGKKCWFYLFVLLGLISVNSQGSHSWCHLNYFLCKEKRAESGNNLFALLISYYFFFLGIFLTCKTYYITTCCPLKMNSVGFTHFWLLKSCTNIASVVLLCVWGKLEREGQTFGGFSFFTQVRKEVCKRCA